MYIDLFDSMNTAHVDEREWWRPKNVNQQAQGVTIAKTALLLRILFGEKLTLVRNQVFDSYAWFKVSREFLNSKFFHLTHKPFVWSAFGYSDLSPNSFIKDAIGVFKPKNTANQFMLSAWPGLESAQRLKIAENIERDCNFKNMLMNIGQHDSKMEAIFAEQAYGLQYFYEYLCQQRNQGLISNAYQNTKDRNIWVNIDKVKGKIGGIDPIHINHIFEKAKAQEHDEEAVLNLLENRSALYSFISDLPEDDRSTIRKYIDGFYNLKNCYSSTNGIGFRSVFDQISTTSMDQDSIILKNIENAEESGIYKSDSLIAYIPEEFPALESVDIIDCLPLLEDLQFQDSCNKINRYKRAIIELPHDSTRNLEYSNLSKSLQAALDDHQEFLSQRLGNIIQESNKIQKIVVKGSPILGAAVGATTGQAISIYIPDPGTQAIVTIAFAIIGASLPLLKDTKVFNMLPTSAVSKASVGFRRAVKRNFF